jgi:hypothetical protein
MDDLTAFINARLDEDEAAAKKAIELGAGVWSLAPHFHTARHSPARVLREVAAKRAILRLYDNPKASAHVSGLVLAMVHIAAVWSDHPDYRAEWRPDAAALPDHGRPRQATAGTSA